MYGAGLGQVNRRLCEFADAAFAWIAEMDEHQMDATRKHTDRALGAPDDRSRETACVPRGVLSRRSLMTTAIGGGAAGLIGCVSFVTCRDRTGAMPGSSTFAVLWAGSGHLRTIGKACLKALPAVEASKGCLTRTIFGDMRDAGSDCWSAGALAQSIRERSRDDFRDGRIVTVDGWMLSLTETRVYALAALLPSSRETVE